MTLHLLSLDFRRAPLSLREQVAFAEHSLPQALRALQKAGAAEGAILSTCNRVELLAQLSDSLEGATFLLDFLSQWHQLPQDALRPYCVHRTDEAAARHLIRIACGLESLVPGEMQILGQVKEAARVARESNTLGALDRLIARALGAGRRARSETTIAQRPVSISHAAVALIQAQFGKELAGRSVLLIGSGKMGAIAAQQLHKAGATHFIVANRTLEHACDLARRWDGTALSLDEIPEALAQVDAVIAATGAPHLIVYSQDVIAAMAKRAGQSLLLIDLAVPRDIDPEAGEIPGVTLCDVDGLQAVVSDSIALRNEERDAVESIVQEELGKFLTDQAARRVAPTIVRLRRFAEQIREAEVEKALARLSHLSEQERAIVEALSRGLVNKLLHEPTACLREKAVTQEGAHFQETLETLFALEEGRE